MKQRHTKQMAARTCRRIGLISDSHGEVDSRIRDALSDCDLVVHAGDIGSRDTLECWSTERLVCVFGNNDTPEKWGHRGADELALLPEVVTIDIAGGSLVVIHGHQFARASTRHQLLRERFNDATIIVYGHSHRLLIDDGDLPWVLNPGACGRARTFGGPSAIVLERAGETWQAASLRFEPTRPSKTR